MLSQESHIPFWASHLVFLPDLALKLKGYCHFLFFSHPTWYVTGASPPPQVYFQWSISPQQSGHQYQITGTLDIGGQGHRDEAFPMPLCLALTVNPPAVATTAGSIICNTLLSPGHIVVFPPNQELQQTLTKSTKYYILVMPLRTRWYVH